ncbi:MAG: DUF502 domain-containing protein [Dehalococcoidia bacterium]
MDEEKTQRKGRRITTVLRRRYGGRLRRRITGHLRRTLVAGILLLVPVALTYFILRFIFDVVDGVLQPGIQWVSEKWGVELSVPGLGVILAVALIYVAGLFVANILGRRFVRLVQTTTQRVPLIGSIYSAVRQLVESFSGVKQTGFKRVVMVQYPRMGAWSIGFLTAITSTNEGGQMAVVYIPTAPLPNSGWVAVLPVEEVLDTDLSVQAAMQLVFSGGIVSPAVINTSKLEMTDNLVSKPSSDGRSE